MMPLLMQKCQEYQQQLPLTSYNANALLLKNSQIASDSLVSYLHTMDIVGLISCKDFHLCRSDAVKVIEIYG